MLEDEAVLDSDIMIGPHRCSVSVASRLHVLVGASQVAEQSQSDVKNDREP